MYIKCRRIEIGRHVFARMSERGTASWNAMITANAQNGSLKEALALFHGMLNLDVIS